MNYFRDFFHILFHKPQPVKVDKPKSVSQFEKILGIIHRAKHVHGVDWTRHAIQDVSCILGIDLRTARTLVSEMSQEKVCI